MTENKKIFIIDTSVLLYDKNSIHSFGDNIVLIPLVVLDELDRFKDKKGLIGENARYVNRYLDDLRQQGNLHEGIEVEGGQIIKVALEGFDNIPLGLDKNYTDNMIIALGLNLSKLHGESHKIIIVTKDINLRVKCDSLGVKSEDYYKDTVTLEEEGIYKGYSDIELEDDTLISRLYSSEKVLANEKNEEIRSMIKEELFGEVKDLFAQKKNRLPYENEFFCLKYESSSYLGRHINGEIKKVKQIEQTIPEFVELGIKSKNREQLYALNALLDTDLPLVSLLGLAGSGKTFITLMAAYALVQAGKYERIVFTRNMQPVGKEIGFLPGDADDKMEPWLAPIMDNFRVGLKDHNLTYFYTLKDKGIIEVAPLSFIRGRTFSNTILIMDEAQNATIHELKTVITRIGENSKIILMGDIDQIDTPYIDELSNGLTIVTEKFKNEKCSAHISLKRGERSYLSDVAARIL